MANEPPPISSIQAAFAHQNTATVDCTFTTDLFNFPASPSRLGQAPGEGGTGQDIALENRSLPPARYIRTSEMLYRNGAKDEHSSERNGATESIDVRMKQVSKDGVVLGGTSLHFPRFAWAGVDRIDHIMFPAFPRKDDPSTTFLYGWIKYGKVVPTQETINGHACWKVDITDTGGSAADHLEVWLDPDLGLCPRRLKMHGRGATAAEFTRTVDWDDYVEIANGFWFPRSQNVVSNNPLSGYPDMRSLYTATKLDGTKTYTKSDLRVTFAPGTPILLTAEDGSLKRTVQP